jgi:hypothetical protein
MTKSRAFNRFHRWTAKMRRRHLKTWLPEPREGEPVADVRGADLRRRAWQLDQLHELERAEGATLIGAES